LVGDCKVSVDKLH